MNIKLKHLVIILVSLFYACKPEAPVTSFITIDLDKATTPVNADLYGITLEEINHAIEGGLYAELIQNRSFEDGWLPAGCSYDAVTNSISTPAGWEIPFVAPHVIPGWRALSEQSYLSISGGYAINEQNPHYLQIQVPYNGKGGAVAEGFYGIPVQKGEKYHLSFFVRNSQYGDITVEIRDSTTYKSISNTYRMAPVWEWTQVEHTFTATADAANATLVFAAENGTIFNIDMVSLFPQKTWKSQSNGLRIDLMEAMEALKPKFIRFPGGATVGSYTHSMIPRWQETIGPIELRKSAWSIWGYGASNGFGFHEQLQLCEDLNARPIYVANAGILDQRYKLRYEDTKNMEIWKDQILSALAYANHPSDSVYGKIRASNGRIAPFSLNMVEIGNQNHGSVYARHYQYLRKEVQDSFPQISLMGNDTLGYTNDWYNTHYKVDVDYLLSSYNTFNIQNLTIHTPMYFIGEFGAAHSPHGGTLRAAVGEAAFLIGAEKNPFNVKGVAYAPLLGHAAFPSYGTPAIQFDASRIVKHPSYYVLEMFANNRGDELVHTIVDTYQKPLISFGHAAIMLHDFSFDVKDILFNENPVPNAFVHDERTNIQSTNLSKNTIFPNITGLNHEWRRPNRPAQETISHGDVQKRYMTIGNATGYNYTLSAKIKRTTPGRKIELHVRDNGLPEERSNYIALTIDGNHVNFHHCAGGIKRLLSGTTFAFEDDRWYTVKITCEDDRISCYIDNQQLLDTTVRYIPSLVAVATRDIASETIILKVVNTTYHDEWASLGLIDGRIENEIEVIQLAGKPDAQNTLDVPDVIVPERKTIKYSFRRPIKYLFPPNSITIIRMKQK